MALSSKQSTLLVLAMLMIVSPFFFPSNYYYRVGSLVFVNSIAVVGIVILTGYAGQISLGHAGFVGIGGYACALLPVHFGVPPALAVVLGAMLCAGIAHVVGRPILRLKGYYLAVASLGFGVLVAMVLANEGHITGGPDGIKVRDPGIRDWLGSLGIELTNPQFWYGFTGLVLLLGAWLALNLRDSATGRALRALHGSEVAARTAGVDVARAKLHAFVISAVYASVAGSLLALQNRLITPDAAGFMHSIELVTMAVLGGAGSVLGGIFGAALLILLPQVLTVLQDYEHVVLGLVMMLVMIFLPAGLIPSARRLMQGRGE